MKLSRTLAIVALSSSLSWAGTTGAPAGNYIQNVSTNVVIPAFKVSSGTVSTQLTLPFASAGQCLKVDASNNVASVACGGGGSSALGVTLSGVSVTSPTVAINFVGPPFTGISAGGTTSQIALNPSSVTLQGNTFNTQGNLVQLDGFTRFPAVSGNLITSLNANNLTGTASLFNFNVASATASGSSASPLLSMTVNDLVNNPPGIVLASTGTGSALTVTSFNKGGNCIEGDTCGGVIIKQFGVGDALTIVSSYTETQLGTADIEIWDESPTRNDPELWFHRTNQNSSPEIRFDSPSPNTEMVNTSTDNAHGLGKWEPFAEAFHGTKLQVNSRAWDNSTFETVAQWTPLSQGPALELLPQTPANGDPNTQSFQLMWVSTESRTLGFKAPTTLPASWFWTWPNTFNNSGQIMYQKTNGPDRQLAFTTDGTSGQVLTMSASSTPTWTTPSGSPSGASFTFQYKNTLGGLTGGPVQFDANNNSLEVATTGAIELFDTGTHYVGFRSSNTLPGSTVWILPDQDGSNGDVMTTTGGGANNHTLKWTTPTGSPAGGNLAIQYKSGSGFAGMTNLAADTSTNGLSFNTTAQVEFYQADNSHYVGFRAQDTGMGGSTVWQLPLADGTSGQVLTTAGTGAAISHNLFWTTPASGSGAATNVANIWTAPQTFSSSVTVPSANGELVSFNLTAGSMTVNNLTNSSVVQTDGSHNLTTGAVSLTSQVSGVLPSANMAANTAYKDVSQLWTAPQTHSSSMTITSPSGQLVTYNLTAGSVTVSNLTASSVVQTDGSQNLTTGAVNLVTQVSGVLPSANMVSTAAFKNVAQAWTAPQTFTSSTSFTSGIALQGSLTKIANYTATATDSLIFANAVSGAFTVTLPAANSSSGQFLQISKVDTSTQTVTIQANGTDVIGGTGTVKLNAYMQTAGMVSDGNGHWLPWGQGIQQTPNILGPGFFGASANGLNVSSQPVCESFTVAVPVAIDSMTVFVNSGAGNIDMGIYDTNGLRLASVGGTAMTLATGRVNYALSSIVNLAAGNYWECIVTSLTSSTFSTATVSAGNPVAQQTCSQNSANYPLPSSLTFPCTSTRSVAYNLWAHPVGGAN